MRPKIDRWPAPVFSQPIRIYYEDTDAGGIVYHANYLRFMERTRTEWLRAIGVQLSQLESVTGTILVVRDAALEFIAPARLDDQVQVDVRLLLVRRVSITLGQTVSLVSSSITTLLCSGTVRIAAIDKQSGRPVAMPDAVTDRIAMDQNNE
jgi:acyl-CoA thioester hydrolase